MENNKLNKLNEDSLEMVTGGGGIALGHREPGSGHLPTWSPFAGDCPPSYQDASKSEMEKIRESYIDY